MRTHARTARSFASAAFGGGRFVGAHRRGGCPAVLRCGFDAPSRASGGPPWAPRCVGPVIRGCLAWTPTTRGQSGTLRDLASPLFARE